ncbi:hypothetical protein [Mycolicibacterium sp. YH-1]|uniref:hypothetical protein n=1 Tax=Mycolicibacterium sp. YH-1 TaxID=2908837 RepID=UPI001F4C09D3|nr:hypothetical protein [Mycolicibacterium sp. YH-1]UNB50139.1 hypothetical protein L0M16_19315 [Mycolicibacterium sp. YH-1]
MGVREWFSKSVWSRVKRAWARVSAAWARVDRAWNEHTSELACLFAALALIFALLFVIQTIKLDDRHFDVDWGTPWDALASIGTVGALGVAVYVFWHGMRQRSTDERRRQAELVTAWIHDHAVGLMEPDTVKVRVALVNASTSVAYDVKVVVSGHARSAFKPGMQPPEIRWTIESTNADSPLKWFRKSRASRTTDWSAIAADWTKQSNFNPITSTLLSSHLASSFGPRELARGNLRILPPGTWLVEIRLPGKALEPDVVDVRFRDHRDLRWRRGALGNLTESPKTDLDSWESLQTGLLNWNFGNSEVQTLFVQPLNPN